MYLINHASIETLTTEFLVFNVTIIPKGRHGCDRMLVGFITTCAISAYHL